MCFLYLLNDTISKPSKTHWFYWQKGHRMLQQCFQKAVHFSCFMIIAQNGPKYTQGFPKWPQDLPKTPQRLPKGHQHHAKIVPKLSQQYQQEFQTCPKHVLKVFQRCSNKCAKSDPTMFHQTPSRVSKVFQKLPKIVPTPVPKRCPNVFQKCPKLVPKSVPTVFQQCSNTCFSQLLERSNTCFGQLLEHC